MRSLAFFCLFLTSGLVFASTPLTTEDFSNLPSVIDVQLSPNGKSIAYLRNIGNHTLLVTTNLEARESNLLIRTDNEKYKIKWHKWANDEQVVFGAFYPSRRYGTATTESFLMVADTTGKDQPAAVIKPKLPKLGTKDHIAQFQDNVIDWLPNDPDHILVSVDFDKPVQASVFKVNVRKKSRTRIQRTRADVRDWQTDQQGRVRIGSAFEYKKGKRYFHVLDLSTQQWHTLWEHQALLDPPFQPLGFGLDPHLLYLRADHKGKGALYTIDTRKLDEPPTLFKSDPKYDIRGSLIYSEKSGEAIGIYHSEAKGSRIYWDPIFQGLEAAINKNLPDTNNQLVSFSRDEQRYILFASSDTEPGTYYVGDRSKGTLEPVVFTYPNLNEDNLSPKSRVRITMRDGLNIEAYLTIPKNQPTDTPLPAVIFPHGGPISRDYGGFDYWTQFFAHKGLVVLQPNFRGSAGYGHDFALEAAGNYGLGMQDDLIDSTRWLIKQGIADPNRICIVGASYGGYAALTASFKTPELYQCAVSFAGISDLPRQLNKYRNFTSREIAKRQFGTDRDQLRENSAYYNIEKIDIPILLVHGDRDRVVPPIQSKILADKLKDTDKEFAHIELENGSHYLLKQKNRTALFNAMDKFLAKHLRLGSP